MALQSPGDVQGSELSGMRSTCLLGFNEPLVLFSDNLLGTRVPCGLLTLPRVTPHRGCVSSDRRCNLGEPLL